MVLAPHLSNSFRCLEPQESTRVEGVKALRRSALRISLEEFLNAHSEGRRGRSCPRLFADCIYVRCPLFACCCCDVDVGPLVKDSRRLRPRSVLFSPPGSSRPDAKIRHCSEISHLKDDSCQVDRGSSRRRDVVRALLRSVSCETHACSVCPAFQRRHTNEASVASKTKPDNQSLGVTVFVTGNFVHR